jgi:hypothetical protein
MKQKIYLFTIHQTATSLQRTNNLNPRTRWYPALDESNRMKSTFLTIHPGKNPPPQNGASWNPFKSTGFTSSTFPIQLDFSQNQPCTITLNTGSPRTLSHSRVSSGPYKLMMRNINKNWEAGSLTSKVPVIEAPLRAKKWRCHLETEIKRHSLLASKNPPLAHMFGTSRIWTPAPPNSQSCIDRR